MTTKQTQHTPGPWKTYTNGTYGPWVKSCDARHPEYGESHHDIGIERHAIASTHGSNRFANARLIAAAPALLEAAEILSESLRWEEKRSGTTYHGIAALRTAIAKARGGE